MDTKWFARAGVGMFVAIAITVTAIEMRAEPDPIVRQVKDEAGALDADPLRRELVRCQSIGAAGASDPSCLRTWAENRRRFLGPDARPAGVVPSVGNDAAANTTAGNAGAAALSLPGGQ